MITPNKVGNYPVICTELCGLGHAVMRTRGDRDAARGVQRLAARSSEKRGEPAARAGGQGGLRRERLRQLPHAEGRRSARERSGPTSISSPTYAKQAGKPLEDFIRESIVDPNAYVQPGFPKSVMPPFSTLPE